MKPIDTTKLTDTRPAAVTQMFPHQWLAIPRETREKMATQFEIPRSSHSEVHGGIVVSDGRTVKDLSGINIEKMQEFTESKEKNFLNLLEKTINKIENANG